MKIAVIDDGVDQSHPFFDPTGYTYPPGYPKGGRRWTTPRVIVARAFPGPGAGRRGRLPVDRDASFHGTHVGGHRGRQVGHELAWRALRIRRRRTSRASPRVPTSATTASSTIPTRVGHIGNTPELVAAFEAAVRDGMDVINLSGGERRNRPAERRADRGDSQRRGRRRRPGHRRRQLAGRLRLRHGRLARQRARGDHRWRPSSNTHVFAPVAFRHRCARTGEPGTAPVPRARSPIPPSGAGQRADQTLADVGSIRGTDGRPVDRQLCGVRSPKPSIRRFPATRCATRSRSSSAAAAR